MGGASAGSRRPGRRRRLAAKTRRGRCGAGWRSPRAAATSAWFSAPSSVLSRLRAPMVTSRSRIGSACTDRKPASTARGSNRGRGPPAAARQWFTIGWPPGARRTGSPRRSPAPGRAGRARHWPASPRRPGRPLTPATSAQTWQSRLVSALGLCPRRACSGCVCASHRPRSETTASGDMSRNAGAAADQSPEGWVWGVHFDVSLLTLRPASRPLRHRGPERRSTDFRQIRSAAF